VLHPTHGTFPITVMVLQLTNFFYNYPQPLFREFRFVI
jgi:hypothetical protein